MLHRPLPTFPHPGGPHRIKDGISWESRSDRKSVCWPVTWLWPKYSSSVFGLSISAKGLSIVSRVRGDKWFGAFRVCLFDPEAWFSVPAGPGSASLGKLRFNGLLTAAVTSLCLPEHNPLRSLWTETLLLLVWNSENTAVPAMEELASVFWLTVGMGGSVSALMRDFFNGGSLPCVVDGLLSVTLFSRHTSRCPLMVVAVKSLKQTGHCTESGGVDVISFAMLIPAKHLTFNHVTHLTWPHAGFGKLFLPERYAQMRPSPFY